MILQMPFRSYHHYQPTDRPRVTSDTSIHGERLQTTSVAYATTRAGTRVSGNQWYRQEHGAENFGGEVEAQSWEIRRELFTVPSHLPVR